VPVILALITGFSVAINTLIPWSWLTVFFALIRRLVMIFDPMIDTDTLWTVIGITLTIDISYWVFKAGVLVIKKLGNENIIKD